MLCSIGGNGLEVLYFSLADQVPNDRIVKIQIPKYLSSSDQLGKGMVSNSNMRLMCSERNGSKQSILSKWIFDQLICDLDSSKGGEAGFELCLELGIIQYSERAAGDVVNHMLLNTKEESWTLIHKNLGNIFIQYDWALDLIFREMVQLDRLVDRCLLCQGSNSQFVGFDLSKIVLSP